MRIAGAGDISRGMTLTTTVTSTRGIWLRCYAPPRAVSGVRDITKETGEVQGAGFVRPPIIV